MPNQKYLGTSTCVSQLEKAFAKKMGVEYAIAMNSGTSTLHATLVALGIGPGDEVIVPALGPIMTAAAVIHAGAKPVFCDVEPFTFVLDNRACLRILLTHRTKAVISVSLYGLPVRLDEVEAFCEDHNIVHIEDNAQCLFARFKDDLVGHFSHAASYSFEQSKHISCGEGGIVTTNDGYLAENIRRYANQGYACMTAEGSSLTKEEIQQLGYKRHSCIGWNYRMAEPLAEIALNQVERMEEIVNQRRANAEMLRLVLKDYDFFFPQVVPTDRTHAYYTLAAMYDSETTNVKWGQLYDRYKHYGGDGFYSCWSVPYAEPALADCGYSGKCTCAEHLAERIVQFPTNQKNADEITQCAQALRKTCDEIDNCR